MGRSLILKGIIVVLGELLLHLLRKCILHIFYVKYEDGLLLTQNYCSLMGYPLVSSDSRLKVEVFVFKVINYN